MAVLRKFVHGLAILCYIFIAFYVVVLLPFIFGYTPLVVLSGSMETTYDTGSVIYYKDVSFDELKKGDVITFNVNDVIVTHRIYEIKSQDEIITKGDANNTVDPETIRFNDVMGIVSKYSLPYMGYYIKFINSNLYILVIVALILVSDFLLEEVKDVDINKNKKQERRKKHGKEK